MCTIYQESVINSKILANHFKELCENFLTPYRDVNTKYNQRKLKSNNKIFHFLSQMQRLIVQEKCDANTFKLDILKIKKIDLIHIEVFWYLEVCNLISLEEFIKFHEDQNNEEVIQHITQSIFDNFLENGVKESNVRKNLLIDYTNTLFGGFSDVERLKNRKSIIQETIFNLITTNLKELYQNEPFGALPDKALNLTSLIMIFEESKLDSVTVKSILFKMLEIILEDTSYSLKLIFHKQEKVKNNVKKKRIFEFFSALKKISNCNEMIEFVKDILLNTSKLINWDNMLPLITFLGLNFEEGWSSLKTLSSLFVKESFQTFNKKLLSYSFLIARQGCFEKPNECFPSYLQWFGSTFSTDSKRLITSNEICLFFLNFLTEIVPYDIAQYSKIHINRTPWVPMECQSFLSEYITLVKTHLVDLNISTELGICENTTNKSAAVFDVENVIRHFERTNDILNSVFQAAMFCKVYYEKKFLVELMSKFEGKKSPRHKLILKLHSLGKIPNSMFKTYKSLEKNKS